MKGTLASRHICPSCFRRNGAWVLGGRTCSFCSTTMKPVAQVVGLGFEVAFKAMCVATQTGSWRQYQAELRRAARNGMGETHAGLDTHAPLPHELQGAAAVPPAGAAPLTMTAGAAASHHRARHTSYDGRGRA